MKSTSNILISPRITEKGAYLAAQGVYVFNVVKDANKKEIAEAVQVAFKVTPIRVRVVNTMGKARFTRGTNRWGMSASNKKAYVYLKKGDTIELV